MKSSFKLIEVECSVCHSDDKEVISKADIGNIVKCRKCGLFYRSPRLSNKDEIEKYKYKVYDDSYFDAINKAKKEIFISTLKRLDQYKGRILDIGCSYGYFLALARQKGWEPYGVEISDHFYKRAIDNLGERFIFDVPLKKAKFQSDFFDVVTMWDVLDQLMDPLGELKEIRRILKRKGLLIIRVRNMSFHLLLNKFLKKNLFGIIKEPTVFHLYGFNNQNIKAALDKVHFSRIKIKNSKLTIGDPYSQIKFLGNYSMSFIKEIYWNVSEFVSFLSSQSILISPSIIAYAEKT
jgi:SAM-dependent methyltransferase